MRETEPQRRGLHKKLQDFNTKQWDHELILPNAACEKKKLENSLVVIYSSAIKIT